MNVPKNFDRCLYPRDNRLLLEHFNGNISQKLDLINFEIKIFLIANLGMPIFRLKQIIQKGLDKIKILDFGFNIKIQNFWSLSFYLFNFTFLDFYFLL